MDYTLSIKDKVYTGKLVENEQDFHDMLDAIHFANDLVVDLETTGLRWYLGDRIAGIAILHPARKKVWYVAFRHGEGANQPLRWLDRLFDTLAHAQRLHGWNFKFDLHFMQNEGLSLSRRFLAYDVMIALHLLDENRLHYGKNYKLKDCANEFIDPNASASDEELKKTLAAKGLKKGVMSLLPAIDVAEYAMFDVILAWELWEFFKPYLEKWEVTDLYEELNDFMQFTILRMERNGLLVDRKLITDSIAATQLEAEEKLKQIHEAAGYPLNPNSPKQVAAWLGISDARRMTLEEMNDPRAEMIVDYKFLSKAVGTFYEPYLYWSAGDGYIHPSLNITGTVSGRLSSSDPNLQQVPRKPKDNVRGYNVKDVFIAPEGYVLAQFDYKAQELRLAAYFSGEPTITEIFNSGGDPHQMTADRLGVDRQAGKTMNFGLLYGMGVEKFSRYGNFDIDEAERLHREWHNLYPAFRSMHYKVTQKAMQWRDPQGNPAVDWQGFRYIRLPDGRVRHFNGDNPPFFSAWNCLIQSTGAMIMRRATMAVCRQFPNDDQVIPVLTVHDSLILYVRENEQLMNTLRTIKQIMENFDFNPRMEIECAVGKSWGSVEEIKL